MTTRPGAHGLDPASFEELYRQHYGRVLGYALRRTSHANAEDVAGATFLVAWRRRAEIRGTPLPWLLGVARRLLANQLRSSRRSEALVARIGPTAERSDERTLEPLADAPVAIALASLAEVDREALILTAWDELSPAEAAQVLGCPAATFRVRLHRAKKRLVKALAEVEHAELPLSKRSSFARGAGGPL